MLEKDFFYKEMLHSQNQVGPRQISIISSSKNNKQQNHVNGSGKTFNYNNQNQGHPFTVTMFNENHNPDMRWRVEEKGDGDLYIASRNFFIVGQILGVCPIQGLFRHTDCKRLTFAWLSWQTVYNIILTILLVFSAVLNLVACIKVSGKTSYSSSDLAWSANMAVYYSIGAFNYQYFLRHVNKFIQLFKNWQEVKLYFGTVDKKLYRDVNLTSGIIYITCVLEHAYSHLKFFPLVELAERRLLNDEGVKLRLANASAFTNYYIRSHPFLDDVLPYSFPVAIFFFIISKFSIFAWDFGDILISVLSRSLYFKFKMLNEEAERILFSSKSSSYEQEKWNNLTADHAQLCRLVLEFEEILSPLIFASFGVNIYYLCLQLNLGLTPSANNSTIAAVYAVWSFLLIIVRMLSAAIPAAEINVYSHNIARILKNCPAHCYSLEVERTERYLMMNKIGLSGLGCFTITRPFILQLVSVILTFEIVLLQSTSPQTATSCTPKK